MNQRRLTRLVASIFGAALLFATIAVVPAVARPIELDISANSAESEDNDNDNDHRVACTGRLSDDGNTCTINQGTPTQTTDNHAECRLFSNNPNVTQKCIIVQTNGTGKTEAIVRMTIEQKKPASPPSTGVCTPYPTRALALSNQNACQILIVKQTSTSGSMSLNGKLTIKQEIEGDQDDQERQTGGPRLHQFQNAGQHHEVDQVSNTGALKAKLDLTQNQKEEAEITADQFERSTGGRPDQHSTINQKTSGVPSGERKFKVKQEEKAPAGSTQIQDPDDWCCSQINGPGATFLSDQDVKQAASLGSANQADNIVGSFTTTGNATFRQRVTTNAGTTTNQQSGKTIFIVITCGVEGGCFASKPPAPTPTPIG